MMGLIHRLSKHARAQLVQLYLSTCESYEEAAQMLGISRTAIYKYVEGRAHPSDRTLERILVALLSNERTKRKAMDVLVREVLVMVAELLEALPLDLKEHAREKILEAIAPRAIVAAR